MMCSIMSCISVPGFNILGTIRQTGKTFTVKATQNSLDRMTTLTFLRAELVKDPNEVKRFLDISRACAQLKVQGIAQIYDIVSNTDHHYIVAEFVDGPSLSKLVAEHGPIDVVRGLKIACTVAEALANAWLQSRIVYRTLSPSIIYIDARSEPRLIDFDHAAFVPADGHVVDEDSEMIVGTPNFLAPEQIRGHQPIDCRTDMYALGATLYHMLTGHSPFEDDGPEVVVRRQLTDQIPHPNVYVPDLPLTVGTIISRMMMKLPEDRYAAWPDVMGDMQHVMKGMPLREQALPKGVSTIMPLMNSRQLISDRPLTARLGSWKTSLNKLFAKKGNGQKMPDAKA